MRTKRSSIRAIWLLALFFAFSAAAGRCVSVREGGAAAPELFSRRSGGSFSSEWMLSIQSTLNPALVPESLALYEQSMSIRELLDRAYSPDEGQFHSYAFIAEMVSRRGLSPQDFQSKDVEIRRALVAAAVLEIRRQVQAKIDLWRDEERMNRLDREELRQAAVEMRQVEQLFPIYAGEALSFVKTALDETQKKLYSNASLKRTDVQGDIQEYSRTHYGEIQEIQNLRLSMGAGKGKVIVDRIVKDALMGEMSAENYEEAVRGLMDDLHGAVSAVSVHDPGYVLNAAATIARASGSPRVMTVARDLMLREKRSGFNVNVFSIGRPLSFQRQLRAALTQVAIAGPPAEIVPALKPETFSGRIIASLRRSRNESIMNLDRAVRGHPLEALGVIAGAFVVLTVLSSYTMVSGMIAVPVFTYYLGFRGFISHHPVAAIIQTILVGGFFISAALAGFPLGLSGHIVTFAAAGIAVGVAYWSFRTHRPMWGILTNLLLLSLF